MHEDISVFPAGAVFISIFHRKQSNPKLSSELQTLPPLKTSGVMYNFLVKDLIQIGIFLVIFLGIGISAQKYFFHEPESPAASIQTETIDVEEDEIPVTNATGTAPLITSESVDGPVVASETKEAPFRTSEITPKPKEATQTLGSTSPPSDVCSFNGSSVAEGSSVRAYRDASVANGSTCASETRTCYNGVLSGSYKNVSCSVKASTSCSWNNLTIANDESVTAYKESSVPAGASCATEKRTCYNGVLSGSYKFTSCAVTTPPPTKLAETGSVSGFIWRDLDADLVEDTGEIGFSGRTVTILKDGIAMFTTTTDANGRYEFKNIPVGTSYRITHVYTGFTSTGALCDGVRCSSDHSVPLTVLTSKASIIDFGMRSCTLREFGAIGDGTADDTVSVTNAVESSCSVLNGEGLTYKITSIVQIQRNDLTLQNATFLDRIVGTYRRVFYANSSTNLTLKNLKIDRGTDPYQGSITDSADIWISSSSNVTLSDIEIYGDGVGRGILVTRSSNVKIIRPNIHDMKWATHTSVGAGVEEMAGITSSQSSDVTIESPRIRNLYPNTVDIVGANGTSQRSSVTDAIGSSGTTNLTITGAEISQVGEGIDMSGSFLTTNFLIADSTLTDVDGWCYKVTHSDGAGSQGPGVIRDSRGIRCGIAAFVVAGPVSDVTFLRDQAIDSGSNGFYTSNTAIAGFRILKQSDTRYPTNITIKDSSAVDTQTTKTMQYGFHSEFLDSTNVLINSTAQGYIKAEKINF